MPSGRSSDFSINTIVGADTTLRGDIETGGFTRIDGNVVGNVSAAGRVVVGEKARVKSNVSGTAVTIGGVVCGDVIASDSLLVLSSAVVMGDVITRRIQADNGCLIHGRIMVCPSEEEWARNVSRHHEAQGIRSVLPVFSRGGTPRTDG